MKLKQLGWDEVSIILIACFFVFLAYNSVRLLAYPFWLENGESFVIANIAGFVSHGFGYLYGDIQSSIRQNTAYPPMFFLAACVPADFLGVSFFSCRIVSVAASIISGIMLVLIVRKVSGGMIPGLISILVFFTSPFVFYWYPLCRVDMLAVMFTLMGLYAFLCDGFYLSLLFFLLAFYSKQSFIAAPLACAAYMFFHVKKKSESVKYLFSYVFLVLAVFSILFVLTGGEFYNHLIKYQISRVEFHIAFWYYAILFILHLPVFLSIALLFRVNRRIFSGIFGYYLILTMVTSLSIIKYYTFLNLFIELVLAASLLIGVNLKGVDGIYRLALVLGLLIFTLTYLPVVYAHPLSVNTSQDLESMTESVKAFKGLILSEDPYLSVSSSKVVYFNPMISSELEYFGSWNSSIVVDACKNRNFSAIITYGDASALRLFPELATCINTVFNKTKEFNVSGIKYVLYQ